MICVLALIVSGFLAIFSATHRRIARLAFDCVFRKVTLRPCDTGLDTELKGRITGPILRRSPRVGRHVLKHFELYSWILVLLTIFSIAGLVHGGVNYYVYGNCNGLAGGFCVIDPIAGGSSDIHEACPISFGEPQTPAQFLEDIPSFDEFSTGSGPRIVEFGCYVCEFTRRAERDAALLRESEDVRFTFVPVHIPGHDLSREVQTAALCAAEQDRFWDAHEFLMGFDIDGSTVERLGVELGLGEEYAECIASNATSDTAQIIDDLIAQGSIAGTPTFITQSQTLVGPQRLRILRRHV